VSTPIAYLILVAAPVLWGGALVAGRLVTAELDPLTITWIRFLLASFVLIPAVRIRERRFPRPTPKEWGQIALLSVTGVVIYSIMLFSGLARITAVRASVLMALTPAVVALITAALFRERIGPAAVFGIVLAFSGATVTITDGNARALVAHGVSAGDAFLLGGVISWATYTIIARFAMERLAALTVLAYSSVLGVVFLAPIAIGGAISAVRVVPAPETIIGLLYLAFGAAGLAYLLYYEGIRAIGPTRASVFLNVEPVAAIVLGVLILGEPITIPLAIGAVLVMSGLYLVNRRG
jgi:drug/metabolite transporter (DMT)-like permease